MKRTLLLLLTVLALLLAGCDRLTGAAEPTTAPVSAADVPQTTGAGTVIVEGTIVPRDFVRLVTRTGGKIAELLVAEGDVVEQGALIARLEGAEALRAQLAAAQLEQLNAQQAIQALNDGAALASAQAQNEYNEASRALIDAQQALDDLDEDQYETDLDNARSDVGTADDELEDAQDEFDRYKDNDPDNSNRKTAETRLEDAQKKYDDAVRKRDLLINQMDSAMSAVEAAQSRLDDAQRVLDEGQPDPDDLALAQAREAAAAAQVTAANKALSDLELTAPIAGTVTDLDVLVGETVLGNSAVAVIADFSAWYVETTDLTEIDVVSVSEEQSASATPDALPDLQLPATVENIDRAAGQKGGDVVYTVRLRLDETDQRLRWGMTVEVVFEE